MFSVIDRGVCRHGLQHFDNTISGEWLLHDFIVMRGAGDRKVWGSHPTTFQIRDQPACCTKVRKSSARLGPTILHLRPSGRSVRKAFCKWDKTLTRDKLRLFHRSKRLVYGKPNSFWRTSSGFLQTSHLTACKTWASFRNPIASVTESSEKRSWPG